MRRIATALMLAAAVLGGISTARAEPAVERTVVVAVADADQPRVLVRWRILEGLQRYDYYHVYRRAAAETGFTALNGDPIGPLTDVASIEAVFEAPGRADALGWIQDSLGADYANALLYLQSPAASQTDVAKLAFLPDQNYGAALALGLGWLDENVVFGESYVYEVWGADGLGYPIERLGRASAVAGSPQVLSGPQGVRCVDIGDERGHGAAHLRWDDPDADEYFFGYEVFRAPRNGDGSCPDMGPGLPNTVAASRYPVVSGSIPGVAEGRDLFQTHCASCHAHPAPREVPPDPVTYANSGVRGGTLEKFRARQYDHIAGMSSYPHATAALDALGTERLASIFRWIQEIRFRDDGSATPSDPVEEDRWYCYRTYARDLLGQLSLSTMDEEACQARDLRPPEVPALIRSERVDTGGVEICEVSWQRNDDTVDGTLSYEVIRRYRDVPRNEHLVIDGTTTVRVATIAQPSGNPGDRVTFSDNTLDATDAMKRYFYAARALDAAGNTSPLSGWVPCVPRDIVSPPPPTISLVECCPDPRGFCTDRSTDEDWMQAGADGVVIADPRECPPRIHFDMPDDTFRVRLYRSFDGVEFFPGDDLDTSPYVPGFLPMLDQKIWYQLRGFDKSGNLGSTSNTVEWIALGGTGPPPPQIVEVVGTPTPAMPGLVVIRFRALKPHALLGFSLYKHHLHPDQIYIPLGKGNLVTRHHDANLTADIPDPVNEPDQWGILPGAKTLDQLLPSSAPAGDGPYLIYKPSQNLYEMRVDLEDASNLVLRLRAIGWSGLEGQHTSYTWDGWQTGDLELSWPRFLPDNLIVTQPADVALNVAPQAGYVQVRWDTEPDGCQGEAGGEFQPFVVFRRRGHSPNWKQISPLFRCISISSVAEEFHDTDVEDGFYYTYTVIQLDRMGEFTHRRGPTTVCYPAPGWCSGPVPD